MAPPYVLLTGGPGSGKSTVVEALRALGHATVAEAGRAIIRDQTAIGGGLRGDPVAFAEAVLVCEMRSYALAAGLPPPVWFDRGVPDCAAAYLLLGLPVPAHVDAAAARFRYHDVAYVAPPWPDIYVTDAERVQTWEEAVRTHDACVAAYERYGYSLVELPRAPVAERAAFLLERAP